MAVWLSSPLAGWPPPPHDPRERVVLCRVGDWEVRGFGHQDPKLAYFAPRGLLHLQLWHRAARISILTPSRLTAGLYEVFPIHRWKRSVCGYPAAKDLVETTFGVAAPSEGLVLAVEAFFIDDMVDLHPTSARALPSPWLTQAEVDEQGVERPPSLRSN